MSSGAGLDRGCMYPALSPATCKVEEVDGKHHHAGYAVVPDNLMSIIKLNVVGDGMAKAMSLISRSVWLSDFESHWYSAGRETV